MPRRLRFWPLYLSWVVFCALLFVILRDAEDPSRPTGRMLSTDAGRIALAELRARDAARFRDHHVVHIAWSRAGEGAPEERWVVLTDRVPHTALREAVVVELGVTDGRLLRIRRPISS